MPEPLSSPSRPRPGALRRRVRRAVAALAIGAPILLAMALATGHRAPAAASPLLGLPPPPRGAERFSGRVVERKPAGSYGYLLVVDAAGVERWVVTLGHGQEPGALVDVKSFGVRRGFHSKRLGRTFDELVFGIVRLHSPS